MSKGLDAFTIFLLYSLHLIGSIGAFFVLLPLVTVFKDVARSGLKTMHESP